MYAYGLQAEDEHVTGHGMKPTRLLTNVESITRDLQCRCCGYHRHVPSVGCKARGAAAYPAKCCEAVANGIDTWLKFKRTGSLIGSVEQESKMPDMCGPEEEDPSLGGPRWSEI